MSRPNQSKLRIGIIGAGEIVRRRHLPGFETASGRGNRRGLEFHLRERGEILPGKRAARDADAKLGGPAFAPGSRYRLDRHAALHAFGGHRLGPGSGEARFLSGAHVDGSRRSRGNAGRLATFSRAGDDALSAAVRVARRSARARSCSRRIILAGRTTFACRCFTSAYLESRRAGALAAADRDQRPECSRPGDLRRGSCSVGLATSPASYARGKILLPDAPGIRSHRSGFAHRSSAHLPTARKASSNSAASTRWPPAIVSKSTATSGR